MRRMRGVSTPAPWTDEFRRNRPFRGLRNHPTTGNSPVPQPKHKHKHNPLHHHTNSNPSSVPQQNSPTTTANTHPRQPTRHHHTTNHEPIQRSKHPTQPSNQLPPRSRPLPSTPPSPRLIPSSWLERIPQKRTHTSKHHPHLPGPLRGARIPPESC